MPNIYLEKIALTIEDTRAARKEGLSKERGLRAKGAAIGAAAVGAIGGGVGYRYANKLINHPIHGMHLRATGVPSKKLRMSIAGISAGLGALQGAAMGEQSVYDSARDRRIRSHHRAINKALTKSAEVTRAQVEKRIDRNDAVRDAVRAGGFIAGGVGTGAVAGAVGIHKGLKEHGGYSAAKDAMRNAYARRKSNPEKKIGEGSYLTKLEDIKPSRSVAKYIDRSGIARGVGNSFGRTMAKGGLAVAAAGAVLGGFAASRAAAKKTDASDVSYYSKLSKKNG